MVSLVAGSNISAHVVDDLLSGVSDGVKVVLGRLEEGSVSES